MRLPSLALFACLGLAPQLSAQATWKTTVLPVVGSAPETGGQFGAALFRTLQPDDSLDTRPSSLMGNAVATTKGQQRAFVEYDRWAPGNQRRTWAAVIVSRFPLPHWGSGYETFAEPVDYEPVTLELALTRHRKTGRATWLNAGVRAVFVDVESAVLAPDESAFPYQLATAQLGVIHDTRDHLFAPTNGRVVDISLGVGPLRHEGRTNLLTRTRVDLRGYRPLLRGSSVGVQAVLVGNDGAVPIDQMALLGHHTLNRGYTMGRYRDHWMASTQMELRSGAFGWGSASC